MKNPIQSKVIEIPVSIPLAPGISIVQIYMTKSRFETSHGGIIQVNQTKISFMDGGVSQKTDWWMLPFYRMTGTFSEIVNHICSPDFDPEKTII